VHFTFVDMEKAYDTVAVQKFWEPLEVLEINKILMKVIKMLYLKSK